MSHKKQTLEERQSEMIKRVVRRDCLRRPRRRRFFVSATDPQRRAVREFREHRSWSIARMARYCDVGRQQIEALEGPDQSVTILNPALERIMDALDGRPHGQADPPVKKRRNEWVFPTTEQRSFVTSFRIERRWDPGKMARLFGLSDRQIARIESPDQSIYIERQTWERVLEISGYPGGAR